MRNERKPGLSELPDGDGCFNGYHRWCISTETIVSTGDMRPTGEKIPRV